MEGDIERRISSPNSYSNCENMRQLLLLCVMSSAVYIYNILCCHLTELGLLFYLFINFPPIIQFFISTICFSCSIVKNGGFCRPPPKDVITIL